MSTRSSIIGNAGSGCADASAGSKARSSWSIPKLSRESAKDKGSLALLPGIRDALFRLKRVTMGMHHTRSRRSAAIPWMEPSGSS